MYAVTSNLFVRRTRATLRIAELGFLGVVVYTRVQTPLRCGQFVKAGDLLLSTIFLRPSLTNCDIVGIPCSLYFNLDSEFLLISLFLRDGKGNRSFLPAKLCEKYFLTGLKRIKRF
jgi:hypothetical protein